MAAAMAAAQGGLVRCDLENASRGGAHLALVRSTLDPELFQVCGDGVVVDAEGFGDGPQRTPRLVLNTDRVDF